MDLRASLGVELPVIQAPMAGAQGSALAIAVCKSGALGSLPAAMLDARGLAARDRCDARGHRPAVQRQFLVPPGRRAGSRARSRVAADARAVLPRVRPRRRGDPERRGAHAVRRGCSGDRRGAPAAGRELPSRPARRAAARARPRHRRDAILASATTRRRSAAGSSGAASTRSRPGARGGRTSQPLPVGRPDAAERHCSRSCRRSSRAVAHSGHRDRRHRRRRRGRGARVRSAHRWSRSAPRTCSARKRRRASRTAHALVSESALHTALTRVFSGGPRAGSSTA